MRALRLGGRPRTGRPTTQAYRRQLALLPLVLLCAMAAPAEIYRWTDAQGRMHFTQSLDKVPAGQRARARQSAAKEAAPALPSPSRLGARAYTASRARPRVDEGLVIPFRRLGNVMQVNVRINDLVTAPFLIDTGASGVDLPASVAERLGIRIRPDTPTVQMHTANGIAARAIVTLRSVELGGARVENLRATVNPSMEVGLLGGTFFNNFVYQVDAAQSVIHLRPNESIRGGLAAGEWRVRFRQLRDPLDRLEAYLEETQQLRANDRARLLARREVLRLELTRLDDEANRLDVPQGWRE